MYTRTHMHTSAYSFLQAKTEAVARAMSVCEWWAARSQVRPTQSPFYRTECSTHRLHRGQNGRRNKEELMHAGRRETNTHTLSYLHMLALTHTENEAPPHAASASPLHCCPLSVKDMIIIASSRNHLKVRWAHIKVSKKLQQYAMNFLYNSLLFKSFSGGWILVQSRSVKQRM